MAPHPSTLAWKLPWTEEPGRLQSMGSQRVRHDWVTSLSLFIFMHWRRKWQPTPAFLPGESQGRRRLPSTGSQSRTRLKRLSHLCIFNIEVGLWFDWALHCLMQITVMAAAAATKLLQSCLTLCDPGDSSPSGSPIPGILQARTLEWVAISFSNAWKWRVKVKSLSRVWLLATPWTAAYQAPLSMGFSRQEYWSVMASN